ncbi:MAG: class I SAM-dependent methyltransferase [Thermoplasmatales archaeon]|nr:class I SAM-dependent methyltransferase [Thermoplasmatales archaeon]
MKLGRLEKWFMNTQKHAEYVVNRAQKLLKFIELKEKQDFLEVGCGNGAVSKYIAKKYHLTVTGVDVDPEQIEFAKKNTNTPNLHFLEADATHLAFEDNSFDIVLSFGVMHHISNWLDAMEEIKRVLRPKGYFIYMDLVYHELTAKIGRSLTRNYGIITMRDLNSFIEKNKFSTIHASLSKSILWNEYEAVYQKS